MLQSQKSKSLYIIGGDNSVVSGRKNSLKILKFLPKTKTWQIINEVLPLEVSRAATDGFEFIRSFDSFIRFGDVDDIEIIEEGLVGREFMSMVEV